MKRIAIISAIFTVLVGLDGIYMMVKNYKPDDVNKFNLSDGGTVLVSAVLLLIITVIAAVMAKRSGEAGKSEL